MMHLVALAPQLLYLVACTEVWTRVDAAASFSDADAANKQRPDSMQFLNQECKPTLVLAMGLHRKGKFGDAVKHYRQMLQECDAEDKNMLQFRSTVFGNLGAALQSLSLYPDAISSYQSAVKLSDTPDARLLMNLATALEANGDAEAALIELSAAHKSLTSHNYMDRDALVHVLSNSASIASTHQLWNRDKIERAYLAAIALDPNNFDVQQNLLLFKKQGERALQLVTSQIRSKKNMQDTSLIGRTKKPVVSDSELTPEVGGDASGEGSQTQDETPPCCSAFLQQQLCISLSDLALTLSAKLKQTQQYQKKASIYANNMGLNDDGSSIESDGKDTSSRFFRSEEADDFSSPDLSDVRQAQKLVCDKTIDTADNTYTNAIRNTEMHGQSRFADRFRGPIERHIRRAIDCTKCSHSREGRLLHTVLGMEHGMPDGIASGEAAVTKALEEIGNFQAWHMSLGKDKCDILQSAIEDRVEQQKDSQTKLPFIHVEFGGYMGFSALCAMQSVPVFSTRQLHVISVEHNPIFAAYARTIFEFLGVPSSSVHVVVGDHNEFLRQFDIKTSGFKIGSVLLDHWKGTYLESLRAIEHALMKGAVVLADNTLVPGVPQAYLAHVRNKTLYESSYSMNTHLEQLEEVMDAIEVSYIR